jgi:hypothetical protein
MRADTPSGAGQRTAEIIPNLGKPYVHLIIFTQDPNELRTNLRRIGIGFSCLTRALCTSLGCITT